MKIDILYFASLKEQTKKGQETFETKSTTALELYQELNQRYHFKLSDKHLRVAINESFVAMEAPLNSGDVVAFIPPVAGG